MMAGATYGKSARLATEYTELSIYHKGRKVTKVTKEAVQSSTGIAIWLRLSQTGTLSVAFLRDIFRFRTF